MNQPLFALAIVLQVGAILCWFGVSTRTEQKWTEEHSFWYTKHERAYLRFNDAFLKSDLDGMNKAQKEMQLYGRRMESVVPPKIKAKWASDKAKELQAALSE